MAAAAAAPARCAAGPACAEAATIGSTQGWTLVDAALEATILADGYTVKDRPFIPITLTHPQAGAQALRRWEKHVGFVVVLEVHSVDPSKIQELPPDETHPNPWTVIMLQTLPGANLRVGTFITRKDGLTNVCPFCSFDHPKDSDYAKRHMLLGKRWFKGTTELVAPGCCHEGADGTKDRKQEERQARLLAGKTVMLYHQTDKQTGDLIEKSGKMLRGKTGTAGGAIYFALSPRETQWKTAACRGTILECEVQLGTVLTCDISDLMKPPYKDLTFAHMMQPATRGEDLKALKLGNGVGDSILLNRGNNRHPGQANGMPSGPEVVIFSWQQVQIKRRLDLSQGAPEHDRIVKPLRWFHDEINTAWAQLEKKEITKNAYEDIFFKHNQELLIYRNVAPKDHAAKALELIAQNHQERLDQLQKAAESRKKVKGKGGYA